MRLTQAQAMEIAMECGMKSNLISPISSAKYHEKFDVEGQKAWIAKSFYELFGEKKEYFYIISDKTGEVEYTMNEHGKHIIFNIIVFSIHDRWLSRKEAEKRLMCYSQARSEKRLKEFMLYEAIYLKAFLKLHELFHMNLEIVEADSKKSCPKKSVDFLQVVKSNVREQLPFKNIRFKKRHMTIDFGFDLTFKLTYSQDEISLGNTLENIFLENGLNVIEKIETPPHSKSLKS